MSTSLLNETACAYPSDQCIHQLFEAQVTRSPHAVAVVCEDNELTFQQLNARANQLASHLRKLDVGSHVPVGIFMNRTVEMIVAMLGVLKAGLAYMPLDPLYPASRLAFMVEDSGMKVIVTQSLLIGQLPKSGPKPVYMDTDSNGFISESELDASRDADSQRSAYVIYTSGSTGNPKGVVVTHRNVVNFFAGMDAAIGLSAGSCLAVTSIAFDISVLEIFWTLTRGMKLVLLSDQQSPASTIATSSASRPKIDFSLFYFASTGDEAGGDKYRLLLEGAQFADKNGFAAVWTPERHFHSFGGLYPNPAVTGAAIAAVTNNIQIRAGSVVMPLQNSLRVAEEWSVVDNLSNGRVGVSFASGWQANDFVLAPQDYANRRRIMFREMEIVRKLWRGESIPVPDPTGKPVDVRIYPKPIQKELPVWLTAAGALDTFRAAGEIGANILTHLLDQTLENLTDKIRVYRQAWRESGFPGEGQVTLMMHTFVGEDLSVVQDKVRGPLMGYLRSSSDLVQKLSRGLGTEVGLEDLSEEEMKPHWDRAFDRYFETSGLFGPVDRCVQMIERLRATGIDEVACLIDFGVDTDSVLASLRLLKTVMDQSNRPARETTNDIPELIRKHSVTHLQCTPSLARILVMDQDSADALGSIKKLLIGGETLPAALAKQLSGIVGGDILNMYGPTETTIWSTTYPVNSLDSAIPIGRPIANTQVYVLDPNFQILSPGAIGELFIGGDGVAQGYLNRPDLTAERFLPDPFGGRNGRLYRTGDLVRYTSDGVLEFLGRADYQVKLRGFRIELGEVEAVLEQHEDVREAVVAVRDDEHGDKLLVAYIVLVAGSQLHPSMVRTYMEGKLPNYMVPSRYMTLAQIPRMLNGKVDRNALPAPDRSNYGSEANFLPPRTSIERDLAEIWAEVLGLKQVGVDSDFFDLGGHSLLATRVITRVKTRLGVSLSFRMVFQSPTLEAMAKTIGERQAAAAEESKLEMLLTELEHISEAEAATRLGEASGEP